MSSSLTNPTKKIVDYAIEFEYNDIPEYVVEHSKVIILDNLGAMLAASNPKYPASKIISEFVKEQGGSSESTIIGREYKAPSSNAALANGTFAYLCDIESYHVKSVLHETSVVLPSVLAVGEKVNATGKELITSFILGIDLAPRLSYALNPNSLYSRGFHPSAIVGCLGAALAVSKLLDLDHNQTKNAFGLAATQSSGLLSWENDPTEMSRPFGCGVAARNGVTAALLAEKGFGGPEVLKGKYTVFNAFSSEKHLEALFSELGSRFEITEQTIKLHSSCAFTHTGLDAFLKIMKDQNLTPSDIIKIDVRFAANGAKLIDASELKSHNIQYILSVAAHKGEVKVDDILFEQTDPSIWELSKKVNLIYDKELEPYFPKTMPTIVTVKTKNRSFTERVDSAKGTPENPITHNEIKSKYQKLASTTIDKSLTDEIAIKVDELDKLDDIHKLTQLLNFKQ